MGSVLEEINRGIEDWLHAYPAQEAYDAANLLDEYNAALEAKMRRIEERARLDEEEKAKYAADLARQQAQVQADLEKKRRDEEEIKAVEEIAAKWAARFKSMSQTPRSTLALIVLPIEMQRSLSGDWADASGDSDGPNVVELRRRLGRDPMGEDESVPRATGVIVIPRTPKPVWNKVFVVCFSSFLFVLTIH
jgi:hypothetical protein